MSRTCGPTTRPSTPTITLVTETDHPCLRGWEGLVCNCTSTAGCYYKLDPDESKSRARILQAIDGMSGEQIVALARSMNLIPDGEPF